MDLPSILRSLSPRLRVDGGVMLNLRVFYTLYTLVKRRKALQTVRAQGVSSVLDLCSSQLIEQGIEGVVLDFDGVLAAHGKRTLHPEVKPWLDRLVACPSLKIAILSNNPSSLRQAFFAQHYPAIPFIRGVRKKPYPEGLFEAARVLQCPVGHLLMVDDRLLTGCLAALNAGARALWISKPYQDFFSSKCLLEIYFSCLRKLDRLMLL